MAGVPAERSDQNATSETDVSGGNPSNPLRDRGGQPITEACAAFDQFRPKPRPLSTASKGLLDTIESQVIPRLMLAHGEGTGPAGLELGAQPDMTPDEEDVREFTHLALEHDESVSHSYLHELRARGASLESLFLNLLAPTAQRLGEMWEEDTADFVSVTVALGRLQHVTHLLRQEFGGDSGYTGVDPRRRALMTSYAGDQHIFGILMVSEFLRHAHWDVAFEPSLSVDDTLVVLHDQWFAIVGLSLSCDQDPERVRADIDAIRRASRNEDIGVMVGGRMIREHPNLAEYTGADATARDAKAATSEAENLFAHSVSS